MTGQLFACGRDEPAAARGHARGRAHARAQLAAFRPDQHTHLRARASTTPAPRSIFRDVRKFGKVPARAPASARERLDKLGVDALEARAGGSSPRRAAARVAIKSLLLDQVVLAGVGNIYADEALFLAGVRPTRPAAASTREECERSSPRVRSVMRRSIETGGSSISDYVRPDGSDGGYQDERRVYAREGEPCPRCGARIRRHVIGQRSSHYCPRCQR